MNKTTTLILMAAGMATMPLVAADSPAAAESFTALAAPAAGAQQLAEQFAPAALLPADVDLAIVLPHVAEALPFFEDQELPIDSLALGFAKGNAASLLAARNAQLLSDLPEMIQSTAEEWKEAAADHLAGIISQAAASMQQDATGKAVGEAQKVIIHPIYLLASPKAGAEETLRQTVLAYSAMLAMAVQDEEGMEAAAVQGLNGIKISGAKLAGQIDTDDSSPAYLKNLKETLAKRSFYLLGGVKNGNAAVVLCENPEEISWAPSAEQSVLAGEPWKPTSAGAESQPLALLSLSPETAQAFSMAGSDIATGLMKQVGELFQTMAEKDSAQADAFRAAAAGLGSLSGEFNALCAPIAKPTTLAVWMSPGHVHATLTGDNQGTTYKPGKLRLPAASAAPQNIIYFESTGIDFGRKADSDKIAAACNGVYQGVAASLKPELRGQLDQGVQMLAPYLSDLKTAWEGACTVSAALGDSSAVVVNSAELAPTPEQKVVIPAICLFSGVSDRAKLEQGSTAIGAAIRSMLARSGQDMEELDQVAVDAKISGASSVYSISCPCLPPGVTPGATVTGCQVAAGTSAELNAQTMQCATGDTDFAGCVLSVNFTELAKVVNSLVPADEEDTCDADECGSDVRDAVNTIAEFAESLKATSTIENGVNTIRIDVNLKK